MSPAREPSRLLVLSLALFLSTLGTAQFTLAAEVAAGGQGAVSLDLSSQAASVHVGQSTLGSASSSAINVGGAQKPVATGDHLTPAEFVALQQVLATGSQSLQLDAVGRAVGGSFTLSASMTQALGELIVPSGVTVTHDFASGSALNLAGNLNNAGTFYAVSSNPSIVTAIINASNIFNQTGALLSSFNPSAALSGLNLTLNALQNITNAGTITSSGNLTMTAGGSIVNALPTGVSGVLPAMQAVGNVDLIAASLVNQGVIASQLANVNIASKLATDLVVQNAGGVMQALAGSINFRAADFLDKANLTILGGDFLSRELNAYTGKGILNIHAGVVSGLINAYAHEAHMLTAGDLNLGTLALTGDPTFYSLTGDVTIFNNISTNGGPLIIVANRNIRTNAAGFSISTTPVLPGDGGRILMVAGAQINCFGGPCGPGHDSPPVGSDTVSTLVIVGTPSATGGSIQLGNISSMSTNGSGLLGNGGNIDLIAFANAAGTSGGEVSLPSTITVTTQGQGLAGTSGNLMIIAGAATPTAVSIGSINTTSLGGGGDISIYTARPVATFQISNDTVFGGAGPGTITTGSITTKDLDLSNTQILTMIAGQDITVTAQNATSMIPSGSVIRAGILATGLVLGPQDVLQFADVVSPGNVTLNYAGDASVRSFNPPDKGTVIEANGGNLTMTSGGTLTLDAGGGGGECTICSAGNITLTANGGNLILASESQVIGNGTNKIYTARAWDTDPSATEAGQGGGIEIAAGPGATTIGATNLNNYFLTRGPGFILTPATLPVDFGANVTITDNGTGLGIVQHTSGVGVSLDDSAISVTRGAVFFDALGGSIFMGGLGNAFIANAFDLSVPPPPPPLPEPPPPATPNPPPPLQPPLQPSFNQPSVSQSTPGDPIAIPTDKTPPQTATPPVVIQPPIQNISVTQRQSESFISTSNCSGFTFDDLKDTYLQGQTGTTFEVSQQKTVLLKEGHMLAGAGTKGLTVQTGGTEIVLPPHAVAIVDARETKPVRVTVLDSDESQSVVVKSGNEEISSLSSGQEVILADHTLSDDELIPVDGVDRQYVSGTIEKSGMQVRKALVPVDKMLEKEPLLNCCDGGDNALCRVSWPYQQLLRKYVPRQLPTASAPKQSIPKVSQRGPVYKPFTLGDSVVPAVYTWGSQGDCRLVAYTPAAMPGWMHVNSGSQIVPVGANHYRLDSGSVLLQGSHGVRIDAPASTVVTHPGAAVIVTVDGDLTRVLDLTDRGGSHVQVLIGRRSVGLMPGREMVILPVGRVDAARLVSSDGLGRRRMRLMPADKQLQIVVNDFSLVDALNKHPMLRELRRSQDPTDRSTMQSILKMAAVISMSADRIRGPYSSKPGN